MADKHPYVPSLGGLALVINHFRKSFPNTVTAETLRKLGYAPKNESYVLNVLRHLKLIDDQGKPTNLAQQAFSQHEDSAFAEQFAELVKDAYSGLFELHGENAWTLDQGALITYFRSSDQTTAIVGKRQASTFQLLAGFAGYKEVPEFKPRKKNSSEQSARSQKGKTPTRKASATPSRQQSQDAPILSDVQNLSNVGLTVRIEVNLPVDGDKATYDRIFRSIRENLLDV